MSTQPVSQRGRRDIYLFMSFFFLLLIVLFCLQSNENVRHRQTASGVREPRFGDREDADADAAKNRNNFIQHRVDNSSLPTYFILY